MKNLLTLAKTLRKKCPWDKNLKMSDIPKLLKEESEEIQEAIAKKDWPNLQEEIGDVLFNLVMLMTLAEEKKHFTAEEVLKLCHEKIVARHTWVFGEDKAKTPEEAVKLWKKNKKKTQENGK